MGGEQSKPAEAKMPDLGAERFQKYKFPFENIVMEGGGAKGIAYIGAIKVLEDAGIMKNIKRFAGTSAGAITAGFLAVGMTSQDVLEVMNKTDMPSVLLDGRPWLPSFTQYAGYLYDLLYSFGVFKGRRFLDWYGEVLQEYFEKKRAESEDFEQLYKGLDGDINFAKLYEALGVEFCTVAYDTKYKREDYFHVKTSPLRQLREAVRMSMSLPVIFQPYQDDSNPTDPMFIDGGVYANFPVYCFDGWWLSMDEGNCFHERLGEAQDQKLVDRVFLPEFSHERFQSEGDVDEKKDKKSKTLGLLLYAENDREFFQDQYEARIHDFTEKNPQLKKELIKPDSEKRRTHDNNRKEMRELETKSTEELKKCLALKEKLDKVKKWHPDGDSMRDCFDAIMTEEDVYLINQDPENCDHKKAFFDLFVNFKDEVTKDTTANIYDNWMPLQIARAGRLKEHFIQSSGDLYLQYLDFVGKSKPVPEEDVGRCVGIDVDYIGTGDFDMSPEDKTFLMMQGAVATVAFLEEYIQKNGLTPED